MSFQGQHVKGLVREVGKTYRRWGLVDGLQFIWSMTFRR